MAKKRRRRGKQGLFSKAINIALTLLAFARPIQIAFSAKGPNTKLAQVIDEATFGLANGTFNLQKGLQMYTPVGAALALGTLKKFVMRKFPVR